MQSLGFVEVDSSSDLQNLHRRVHCLKEKKQPKSSPALQLRKTSHTHSKATARTHNTLRTLSCSWNKQQSPAPWAPRPQTEHFLAIIGLPASFIRLTPIQTQLHGLPCRCLLQIASSECCLIKVLGCDSAASKAPVVHGCAGCGGSIWVGVLHDDLAQPRGRCLAWRGRSWDDQVDNLAILQQSQNSTTSTHGACHPSHGLQAEAQSTVLHSRLVLQSTAKTERSKKQGHLA